MRYIFFSLSTFLFGCLFPSVFNFNVTQYTTGELVQNVLSFYWYTKKSSKLKSGADYLDFGNNTWYKTDYLWTDGVLRELIRKGEKLKATQELVPYYIHLRFNQKGSAVYQHYRLDQKIFPLTQKELFSYQKKANAMLNKVERKAKEGLQLIQGFWDGAVFHTCSGKQYNKIEFAGLENFSFGTASENIYAVFLGKVIYNRMIIKDLLMLIDKEQQPEKICIKRPAYISLIDD
ncbi:DUF1481 domain-containing protein [Candidatus Photodesmus anomalopis]|uniref:DUF1481 domain-containing protein n=1 Tax=Candidatus Photodesmus katoptron Akat1 TaxID=1236703 RepID=S3DJ49_9GAMM|nr:DUF1481 domain-containing protein [Candidatus Photodesmus katoptron]EPE37174.1 hypothetical protein O1U_0001 [Candidatus Photodesmus katoptron Akat1]